MRDGTLAESVAFPRGLTVASAASGAKSAASRVRCRRWDWHRLQKSRIRSLPETQDASLLKAAASSVHRRFEPLRGTVVDRARADERVPRAIPRWLVAWPRRWTRIG